ncbi:hypothetical protein CDAR_559681 [Caerostris darwini]|uniref:Uncharacterized protein n=1 Tax=Caerostris darwini TaxID=1538125 RepID=A0AAV4W0D8_9ARAC|nr:hypothetical protein CDAR_559681 [Caerostris darwini]
MLFFTLKKSYHNQYSDIQTSTPSSTIISSSTVIFGQIFEKLLLAPGLNRASAKRMKSSPISRHVVFRQITSITENRFLQLTPFSRGNNNINNRDEISGRRKEKRRIMFAQIRNGKNKS